MGGGIHFSRRKRAMVKKATKLNVRLLRKIQRHILEEPKRFIMGDVIAQGEPGEYVEDCDLEWEMPRCGTTACIAGWALFLGGARNNNSLGDAADLLGLNIPAIRDGAGSLFYVGGWPKKFYDAWVAAKTPRGRARVAARRIDFFIATKGTDELKRARVAA
jgi:hypothetical protein